MSLWRIEALPSAIHTDEAIEGFDAEKILYQGARPIFLENNTGRQPLFAYMVAGMLWLFGPTAPAIRLAAGVAVIGIVYGAMKTAETIFGHRVGWLTGLIAGTTVLTLRINRLGTRVSIFPMFLNLAVWQGAAAVKTGRLRHWIATGALLGITYYTYLPSLFIPLAIIAILILSLIFHFAQVVHRWRGILVCNIVMLVVAAPLLIYYVQHPNASTNRTSDVARQIFDQGPEKTKQFLISQVGVMAGMFTVRGDRNPRHNIPDRPVFDTAMALPFIIGLAIPLLRKKTFLLGLLGLSWLIIFLAPSYFSGESPHFLRTTGILAVLFIWPAIGLDAVQVGLARAYGRFASLIITSSILLLSIRATYTDYFLSNFLSSAQVFVSFDGRETALPLHANQLLNAGWTADNIAAKPLIPPPFTLWIQPGMWLQGEVHYFIAATEPDKYPFFKTLSAEATLTPPFALILDPSHQTEWLMKVPAGTSLTIENVFAGSKLFSIYRTPELLARPYTITDHVYRRLDATIPGGINWLSVEYPLTATPAAPFDLTLHLIAPAMPLAKQYALRFDVLGPDGSLVSQSQDLFDLSIQSIFTDVTFSQTIRAATPPGAYTLTASLINQATSQPESFLDSRGQPLGTRLIVGTFEVLRPTQPISFKKMGAPVRGQYDFGPFSLIGYDIDRDQARPGEQVFISLFFHVDEATPADLSFNLFTPYLPTSQWRPGDVLRFVVPTYVPAEAAGYYQFVLQLNQAPRQSFKLNLIEVKPINRTFTEPTSDHPLTGIRFGGVIELNGYTITTTIQDWTLNLVWHALNTPNINLTAFVHIEDEAGNIVAQSDAIPANGDRPTLGWLLGEFILDPRKFAPLPAGKYYLFAGLYDPTTGNRLDQRLKIGVYTVP